MPPGLQNIRQFVPTIWQEFMQCMQLITQHSLKQFFTGVLDSRDTDS